jgi:hypothetical protein
MKRKNLLLLVFAMFMAYTTFAQGIIQGIVKDANSDETLIGATVLVKGTTIGVTTNLDGSFLLVAPAGNLTLEFSYVGYESQTKDISVKDGATYNIGEIKLKSSAIGLDEVNVMASVAVDRKTPVAVTTLDAQTIENQLGSQEFPEVMKNTPSVYVTKQGGGFGDARINVRGFDQRNVAVMINGIPVNDMENGWVYWSNWAGLGDATRTIQIQRGLGASKLAINSVGGTINIITKTSDMNKGGSFEMGATTYGRYKAMLTLSTGKMKSGTAITFVGSRTYGKGYIDATWVDAWSYFLSVSQDIGKKHQLVFTAIGAPQSHGQRDGYYMLDSTQFNKYGSTYNRNWGWLGGEQLNIRVNYYHKPQFALNWYWTINDKAFLATSLYYSVGRGGGSGPLGIKPYKYEPPLTPYGQYDWDKMVDFNANNVDTLIAKKAEEFYVDNNGDTVYNHNSRHIIRNSVNNHNWLGILSTLNYEFTRKWHLTAGLDTRHYKGEHYREVKNLLGGDYWYDSKFGAARVDDKIAYWNDGIVNYAGLFAQMEFTSGSFNAFLAATVSNTWTQRIDYRTYLPDEPEAKSETLSNAGYNFKLGANYNIDEHNNIFINGGYYSRVPFFRFHFLNYRNDVNPDLANETIYAAEIGYMLKLQKFNLRFNGYYTVWDNISQLASFKADNGNNVNAFLSSLQEVHMGLELDMQYMLTRWLRVGAMGTLGNWYYANNPEATLYDDNTQLPIGKGTIYLKDVKVPNQPQAMAGLNAKINITKNIDLGANWLYFANNYANFTPERRQDPAQEGMQAWKLPNYCNLDMRLGWRFKLAGLDTYFNWNVYNVTNNVTLVEAEDHFDAAANAFVFKKGFWSWGRNMNFSLKVRF